MLHSEYPVLLTM